MNTNQETTAPPTFEDLTENLRVNMKLSREMVDILKEENKALRGMATQDLLRISKQKENLLTKIHYLDQNLRETADQLRAADTTQEQNPQAAPLTELMTQLPAEQTAILKQYCCDIKQLRQDIQTQNLINKRFTHDTLTCLNEAISLISNPAPQGGSYGAIRRSQQYNTNQPSLISREV